MQMPPLPSELLVQLGNYEPRQETIGRSGVCVYRLEAACRPSLGVKISGGIQTTDLFQEGARLKWLNSCGIAAPVVLH